MILAALVDDDVDVAHAERTTRIMLPLREPDQRQAPEIRLTCTLYRRCLEQLACFGLGHREHRAVLVPLRSGFGKHLVGQGGVHIASTSAFCPCVDIGPWSGDRI